jgi:hypothetical protein
LVLGHGSPLQSKARNSVAIVTSQAMRAVSS